MCQQAQSKLKSTRNITYVYLVLVGVRQKKREKNFNLTIHILSSYLKLLDRRSQMVSVEEKYSHLILVNDD